VNPVETTGLDVSQMHVNRNLPIEKMSDMTFVSHQGD
jgi:hypothetical protein